MRVAALKLMRHLRSFRPALIGSTFTGHVRKGSDIDIHVFSDQIAAVTMVLDELRLPYDVEHKRIIKHSEERIFTHIHATGKFSFELTVYPENKATYTFKSSITGKAIERATIAELEQFLRQEYPALSLDETEEDDEAEVDHYDFFRSLLQPLEAVKQNPKYHPEGDALYHSLQVFELARESRAWDQEFLLAALLHDIGKAIEPGNHVFAALDMLGDAITPRTAFLIEHHMDAHAYRDRTLGHRAGVRLTQSEDFEDLMLLRELDVGGRQRGVEVCTVDEALDYIRALEEESYLDAE
jgi:hypothetical protein